MNSTTFDVLSREQITFETADNLKKIFANTCNLSALHKELLEINLSLTAYIEESKNRLEQLKLNLAHRAKSSREVVEIFSEKCKKNLIMSNSPSTPRKRNQTKRNMTAHTTIRSLHEDNNNSSKSIDRFNARTFVSWYQRMIDYERQNFSLYLSDDIILEWFGKTIRNRKKVSSFLKHDMQCTRHDFTLIESIDKLQLRLDRYSRNSVLNIDTKLACPLSPEMIKTRTLIDNKNTLSNNRKRPGLRSQCGSPEWEKNCQPQEESEGTDRKKMKRTVAQDTTVHDNDHGRGDGDFIKQSHETDDISSKGIGIITKVRRKCVQVTPPNPEVGQGDCLPSTSSDSEMSHAALNSQLPRKAVECNGYVEFNRTRNSRSADAMKWDRKCKVQICYSEDPLNVGEYIIWSIYYTDESKCRRNLLAAFDEVAKEEQQQL